MPKAGDIPELRAARMEAARIARDAVAGRISAEQARAQWPADEGMDSSIDALAHVYFDHYVSTAEKRTPDQDDASGVIELADLISDGDPLDAERLKGFWGWSFSTGPLQLAFAVTLLALVIYLAARIA